MVIVGQRIFPVGESCQVHEYSVALHYENRGITASDIARCVDRQL